MELQEIPGPVTFLTFVVEDCLTGWAPNPEQVQAIESVLGRRISGWVTRRKVRSITYSDPE